MIPAVKGPKDRYYIIDHHHLALALHEEGVKELLVTTYADLSMIDSVLFWATMDARNWVYPFDDKGKRRDYKAIPKHLRDYGRRSVPLAGRRIAPRRRFRERHDAVQRVPMGGFSAPPREEDAGGKGIHARDGKGAGTRAIASDAIYLPGWCGPSPED